MRSFLSSAFREFQRYETLGRKTMEQVDDEGLFYSPGTEVNPIAVQVKHLHGNMMSRWTDFLTSDGEKDWRERDAEFVNTLDSREGIYELWTEGWNLVFDTIEGLSEEDLDRRVVIRGEDHTVIEAINRQLCHYAYHVGQMVQLGKILLGDDWKSLSIPKGKSREFNVR
jgi:hypothetical protein